MSIFYEEWDPDLSGFPENDKRAQILFLLRFAILAPSGHNMQPWRYRIEDDDTLVVGLEHSRLLSVSDPSDRISYLAVGGTSRCFMRAAEAYGLATSFAIVPKGDECEVRIKLEGPRPASDDQPIDWVDAIVRRVSNRTTYRKEGIAADQRTWLTRSEIAGAEVRGYTSTEDRKIIARLTDRSSRNLINSRAFREELAHCTHNNEGGYKLGMPARSMGFPRLLAPFAKFIIRHANVGSAIATMSTNQLLAAPLICGVVTKEDTPENWLRAGMAHLDTFLKATSLGLAFDTFAAATCEEETRMALTRELGIPGFPQIFFRIGKPAKSAPARAPRLKVEQVIG